MLFYNKKPASSHRRLVASSPRRLAPLAPSPVLFYNKKPTSPVKCYN